MDLGCEVDKVRSDVVVVSKALVTSVIIARVRLLPGVSVILLPFSCSFPVLYYS